MKKFLSALLILLAVSTVAIAQDNKTRTASGDKALLFTMNGLGTFGIAGNYSGWVPLTAFGLDTIFSEVFSGIRLPQPIFGFGMKFYLNDDLAFRGSLGFASSTKSIPRKNDTTGKTDDETDLIIGVAPAVEIHLVNAGPVTAYTGAIVNYSSTWNFSGDEADTVNGTTTRSYNTIGGGVLFGVEWFPWSAISLGAEYQLLALSTSSSTNRKGKSTDGSSYFDIGISAIAVTAGVYF